MSRNVARRGRGFRPTSITPPEAPEDTNPVAVLQNSIPPIPQPLTTPEDPPQSGQLAQGPLWALWLLWDKDLKVSHETLTSKKRVKRAAKGYFDRVKSSKSNFTPPIDFSLVQVVSIDRGSLPSRLKLSVLRYPPAQELIPRSQLWTISVQSELGPILSELVVERNLLIVSGPKSNDLKQIMLNNRIYNKFSQIFINFNEAFPERVDLFMNNLSKIARLQTSIHYDSNGEGPPNLIHIVPHFNTRRTTLAENSQGHPIPSISIPRPSKAPKVLQSQENAGQTLENDENEEPESIPVGNTTESRKNIEESFNSDQNKVPQIDINQKEPQKSPNFSSTNEKKVEMRSPTSQKGEDISPELFKSPEMIQESPPIEDSLENNDSGPVRDQESLLKSNEALEGGFIREEEPGSHEESLHPSDIIEEFEDESQMEAENDQNSQEIERNEASDDDKRLEVSPHASGLRSPWKRQTAEKNNVKIYEKLGDLKAQLDEVAHNSDRKMLRDQRYAYGIVQAVLEPKVADPPGTYRIRIFDETYEGVLLRIHEPGLIKGVPPSVDEIIRVHRICVQLERDGDNLAMVLSLPNHRSYILFDPRLENIDGPILKQTIANEYSIYEEDERRIRELRRYLKIHKQDLALLANSSPLEISPIQPPPEVRVPPQNEETPEKNPNSVEKSLESAKKLPKPFKIQWETQDLNETSDSEDNSVEIRPNSPEKSVECAEKPQKIVRIQVETQDMNETSDSDGNSAEIRPNSPENIVECAEKPPKTIRIQLETQDMNNTSESEDDFQDFVGELVKSVEEIQEPPKNPQKILDEGDSETSYTSCMTARSSFSNSSGQEGDN